MLAGSERIYAVVGAAAGIREAIEASNLHFIAAVARRADTKIAEETVLWFECGDFANLRTSPPSPQTDLVFVAGSPTANRHPFEYGDDLGLMIPAVWLVAGGLARGARVSRHVSPKVSGSGVARSRVDSASSQPPIDRPGRLLSATRSWLGCTDFIASLRVANRRGATPLACRKEIDWEFSLQKIVELGRASSTLHAAERGIRLTRRTDKRYLRRTETLGLMAGSGDILRQRASGQSPTNCGHSPLISVAAMPSILAVRRKCGPRLVTRPVR